MIQTYTHFPQMKNLLKQKIIILISTILIVPSSFIYLFLINCLAFKKAGWLLWRQNLQESNPRDPSLWDTGKNIQDLPLVEVQNGQVTKDLRSIPNNTRQPITPSYSRECSSAREDVNVPRLRLGSGILPLPLPEAHLQLLYPVALDANPPLKSIPLLTTAEGRRWRFRRGEAITHVLGLECGIWLKFWIR